MNKKGVSPLIATVLIIGFTIALAAVVMIWGQTFFQNITEQTGQKTAAEIICVQIVNMKIEDPTLSGNCKSNGDFNFFVTNEGSESLTGFQVKVSGKTGAPKSASIIISTLATENVTVNLGTNCTAGMELLVYPQINIEGDTTTCIGKSKYLTI